MMEKSEWLYCPICGNKTRDKVRPDTELKNYPLFCPKCKRETLIDVRNQKIFVLSSKALRMKTQC